MPRDFEIAGQPNPETHVHRARTGEGASLPAPNTGKRRKQTATVPAKPTCPEPSAPYSASADAIGHFMCETHGPPADSTLIPGHVTGETQSQDAGIGEGHREGETHISLADPELIDAIREQWKRRVAWHRAEKSLTLQAKAICRRLCGGCKTEAEKVFKAVHGKGEHDLANIAFAATWPLIEARNVLEVQRKAVEKQLEKMVKDLHVYEWVKATRGVGPLMLAGIVGEAGDIGSYKSVSALWKRMGLAVMPSGRQRRIAGVEALDHGYSPERRSLMWNIGACILKAQVRKDPEDEEKRIGLDYLGQLYLERKAYEAERVETKAHAHNRSQRYIEKRFLRQLYAAWQRGQTLGETQVRPAPATPSASAVLSAIHAAKPTPATPIANKH